MALMPSSKDHYPEPSVARSPDGGSGTWRVVVLAIVFAVIAAGLAFFADALPAETMLLILGLFAVVGVFSVFAFAAGLFKLSDTSGGAHAEPCCGGQPALWRGGERARGQDFICQ